MKGYRPTWKAFFKTFVFLILLGIIAIPVNILFDTNYLFICHKPPGGTMMDRLGPWPVYLIFVEIIGMFLCLFVFSPFIIMDIRRARKRE